MIFKVSSTQEYVRYRHARCRHARYWHKRPGRAREKRHILRLQSFREVGMALEKQFLKSRNVCKVRFTIPASEAAGMRQACVVGEFNNWNVGASPMKRLKDGSLSLLMEIPVGHEYRFRYLTDLQHWINEPEADGYEYCPFAGADNSLLNI